MSLSYLDYLETTSKDVLFPRRKTMEDRAIYGGAIGYGYAPNPIEQAAVAGKPPESSAVVRVQAQIERVGANLSDTNRRLDEIYAKLFGPLPEEEMRSQSLRLPGADPRPGAFGQIERDLEALFFLASLVHSAARRLEGI